MQLFKRLASMGVLLTFLASFSFSAFADGDEETVSTVGPLPVESISKAAILIEPTTGQIIFENNSNEKYQAAHLVKLMTLLLASEAIHSGKITLETMTITSAHANSMNGSEIWLETGEKISVYELILSITVGNANDGCVALAEAVEGTEEAFVIKMNQRAAELGMTNTNFINSTGLDCDGQYTTANDMALLCKELIKHEDLTQYLKTWMIDIRAGKTNLVSTNLLVRSYNGITGMKAAVSKAAGNCLVASANRDGLSFICVILGAPTTEQRFVEAKAMLNYGFSNYEIFQPEITKEQLKSIAVKGGEALSIDISSQDLSSLVIPIGNSKNIITKITLEKALKAPIKKGQVVGTIQFFNNDTILLQKNIVTNNDVKEMTFMIAFVKLIEKSLKL